MEIKGSLRDGQWHFTLTLPESFTEKDISESLQTMLQDAAVKKIDSLMANLIRPAVCFKVAKVAKLMDLTPETVREYMELPADNYKHLVHTIGDTKHSDRIPLTSLLDWIERNKSHKAYAKIKSHLKKV